MKDILCTEKFIITYGWSSPNKSSFSTDLYDFIFHSFSAWGSFAVHLLSKPPVDRREPHFDKQP
jgi:hypothetical protein